MYIPLPVDKIQVIGYTLTMNNRGTHMHCYALYNIRDFLYLSLKFFSQDYKRIIYDFQIISLPQHHFHNTPNCIDR